MSKISDTANTYQPTVWLFGDGRSGTTWIAELINYAGAYRELFEPFHPQAIQQACFLSPHEYSRTLTKHPQLFDYASQVFSGKINNPRVDSGNQHPIDQYRKLLVKDIFANLFAYATCCEFPQVKPVLLIRNPFAMATSKFNKRHWYWLTDPSVLVAQAPLYVDFLEPFEEIIEITIEEDNYILNLILIWCIINYVPLKQFDPHAIHVCLYEAVYAAPQPNLAELFAFINDNQDAEIDESQISKPSRLSGKQSTLARGSSPINAWMDEMPTVIIDRGLEIMDEFGFGNLYDEQSMPNRDVISRIQSTAKD